MTAVVLVLVLLALVAFLVGAALARRARDAVMLCVSLGLALWAASVLVTLLPLGG
jgi:hypothetical protein